MNFNGPLYLTENTIKELLSWPIIFEAVEQALMSVSLNPESRDLPISSQPPRTCTSVPNSSGILFSMPGFIGNYTLPSIHLSEELKNRKCNSLACKLVTSFNNNQLLENIPNILATILLFDHSNGKLMCILEATEITSWRTAAASLVATQHLFFRRSTNEAHKILSVIGCGVQGRIHAIGMNSFFNFSEVRLWNRTRQKADTLATELQQNLQNFKNINLLVTVSNTVEDCVKDSDVIVTATFASQPLVELQWLKPDCHINAVGAGMNHHSELSIEIYNQSKIYIDYWAGALVELKDLQGDIAGQVGDCITNIISVPTEGITVFQSMGMAIEDAATAQMIYNKYNSISND